MNPEAGDPAHRRDRLGSYVDGGGRNGILAPGQSTPSMNATNNQPARIFPARIFIVEDDPIMKGMVSDFLERNNMRAVSASGRQELVHHFAASEPDLVILDPAAWPRGRIRPAARDPIALRCSDNHHHR
jgi:hypothetical protein